jgi:hypothetical protein
MKKIKRRFGKRKIGRELDQGGMVYRLNPAIQAMMDAMSEEERQQMLDETYSALFGDDENRFISMEEFKAIMMGNIISFDEEEFMEFEEGEGIG